MIAGMGGAGSENDGQEEKLIRDNI